MILGLPVNNLLHCALCIVLCPPSLPTLFSFYCIDLLLLDCLTLKILNQYFSTWLATICRGVNFQVSSFLHIYCVMYRILVTVKIRAQFCNMQRVTHRPRTSFSPICHCLLAYHFDEILLYTLCLHAIFLTKLQDFNRFRVLFFVYFLFFCVCVLESRA